MKKNFQSLIAVTQRAAAKARNLMLLPAVAVMCSPAFAALPNQPAPGVGIGGAAVDDGDWLGMMGAYFVKGITILGLVLGALGFIYVVAGGLQKWKAYSAGRAEISDLKEYFIMGSVLTVFMVVMIGYAISTLA